MVAWWWLILSFIVGGFVGLLVAVLCVTASRASRDEALAAQTIAAVQRELADLGFNPGGPDGRLGKRTREAIEAYQRSRGMQVDGELSLEVLDSLRSTVRTGT